MTLRIGVVGAGIGGLTAAIALHRDGHDVCIYEKTSELAEVGASISLWPNALAALSRVGLEDGVRATGQWEEAGALRKPSGLSFWSFDNSNLIILRSSVQQVLLRAAADIQLRLGVRCTGLGPSSEQVRILFDDSTDETVDLVVGADGLHSAVRASLAPDEPPPTYAGTTAWRAIVHAPGLVSSAWLTIGRGRQFLAAPLPNRDVYWSPLVTMPLDELEQIDDHLDYMRELFGSWHTPIPELLRLTDPDACFATPVFFRPPPTWLHRGRVVLIGDAGHPMTPDLGQGACQAIEDAVVLADCLHHADRPIESMLDDFTSRRLRRVRRIVREARQLGRLNASPGVIADVIRSSAFKIVPKRLSRKHLHAMNGRDALDTQLSASS